MTGVREFALDLDRPLATAAGEVTARRGFVVVRDGGVGEATPLPGWTESLAECRRALGANDDPDALDPAETPAARHGLALARADVGAREAGESLATSLADGSPAARVPVNATVGDGSVEETARRAGAAVDDGAGCVKVKVGAGSVDRDHRRLRAVRRAVGDAVALRADANGAWDRETATRALDRFAPLGLAYVEQPLPADDLAGHRRLREATETPVAVDESVATAGVEAVLDADAADAVVLKPMALGGPDLTLASARTARAGGVDPVVSTTVDAAVARTAAVHVAAAIPDVRPCGLATAGLLAADLVSDPVPVDDGSIAVPDGPGLHRDAFDPLYESASDSDDEPVGSGPSASGR